MRIFLITLCIIIAVCILIFAVWFIVNAALGRCPLCMLKALGRKKLTIDISETPDYENGAGLTPLMGWSSWNTLRNHISEDSIYETAQVLAKTGLRDAGYRFVNIDDCWQSSMRDSEGKLQGDLETFPSGMESLCARINALGLKMGVYSSNGSNTCEDLPASLGNEELDAKTIASWGVEYLKYDFCHNKKLSGSTPIIEYIDLNKKGSRSQYQLLPEEAECTGRTKVIKRKALPTGKALAYLNHGAGSASWVLNAAEGGEYAMTVHFGKNLLNPKRYMQVLVNSTMYEVHFPSGRSFTPDARVQIMVKLRAGENSIKIYNPIVTAADSSYTQYRRMGYALKEASRSWAQYTGTEEKPITYSICEWGFASPWNWGAKAGNMWRTTMDIFARWSSVKHIYSRTVGLYKFASPGHVNDPDMLEVGNGKLTPEENKSHFALWCMMAAPLVLGNDIRNLLDGTSKSAFILDVLTNKSLILIDQDPLVKPAKRIKKGTVDILVRPLYNGDTAICFFNKSNSKKPFEFDINSLRDEEYLDFSISPSGYNIHDIWSDDRTHGDKIAASIPPHGTKVYRISE